MEEGGGGGLPRVSSQMDARTHARTWRSGGRQQHVGGRRERTKDGGVSGVQAGVRCKHFFRVSFFEGSDVLPAV